MAAGIRHGGRVPARDGDRRRSDPRAPPAATTARLAAGGPLVMRKGLSYGWLSARRRIREMVLPVITTATGAFLVVIVFGMSNGIRAQSASLGHAEAISRAVVLIAVTVLLVGVVEVAVATTRTVAHRTRELGVLGANGVERAPAGGSLFVALAQRWSV